MQPVLSALPLLTRPSLALLEKCETERLGHFCFSQMFSSKRKSQKRNTNLWPGPRCPAGSSQSAGWQLPRRWGAGPRSRPRDPLWSDEPWEHRLWAFHRCQTPLSRSACGWGETGQLEKLKKRKKEKKVNHCGLDWGQKLQSYPQMPIWLQSSSHHTSFYFNGVTSVLKWLVGG